MSYQINDVVTIPHPDTIDRVLHAKITFVDIDDEDDDPEDYLYDAVVIHDSAFEDINQNMSAWLGRIVTFNGDDPIDLIEGPTKDTKIFEAKPLNGAKFPDLFDRDVVEALNGLAKQVAAKPIPPEEIFHWTTIDIAPHYDGIVPPVGPRRGAVAQPKPTPQIIQVTKAILVGREHYNPRADKDHTQLYSFTITHDGKELLLTPTLHTHPDAFTEYRFVDQHGDVWMNRIQNSNVPRYLCSKDVWAIEWIKSTTFWKREEQRGVNVPVRYRKKLRRKYDGKMPIIKDPKHYASKDYIA